MRALLLEDRVRLVADHPEPERGPGEALVRMRTAGVCDTDLQLARGYMGYRGVLGHEFVGEVVESDDSAWIGRRVVADINAGCGRCDDCRLRDGHHCSTRTVLGILGRDGALAERLVVPERNLVAVPDEVNDEAATFAEPLAAALHVADEVQSSAEPAVVLGDGKLGQLIARALHAEGAPVTLVGHHEHKLDLAKAVGIDVTLEKDLGTERDRTFAVAVEATGSASGLSRALSLVRPKGTVVLKTTVADRLSVDLSPVVIDELRVVGSRCGDMSRAIEALSAGRVDPLPLVSDRFELERAEAALQRAGERGVLKVLVLNPTG